MLNRNSLRPCLQAIVVAAVALRPEMLLAQGCAMCKTLTGGPGDPLGIGMNTSILFMMSMPFVMCGSVGAWIAYMFWRSRRDEQDSAPELLAQREELS